MESTKTVPTFVKTKDMNLSSNQFIEQKDQSATYIDMHEIHVEMA